MSTIRRGTPSQLAIPQSQALSAPVLEFRCLYTHDLRRKQKRFQDGFLKYHTFNKRIMVYDELRNFIGDTHWQDDEDIQDGDDVTLEKGVMVQVQDAMGTTQTDLTDLLLRKPKGLPKEGRSPPPARSPRLPSMTSTPAPRPQPISTLRNTPVNTTQRKHRPLTSFLKPSQGPIGKAVIPTRSPYDVRNAASEDEQRSAKRQRVEEPSKQTPWSVTKTVKTTKSLKEKPLWAITADARSVKVGKTVAKKSGGQDIGQTKLAMMEFIDITSDNEPFPSDITLIEENSSNTRLVPFCNRLENYTDSARPAAVAHSLTRDHFTPVISPAISQRNFVTDLENIESFPFPSSSPMSTTSKPVNARRGVEKFAVANNPLGQPRLEIPQNPRAKQLRLSTATPRKMLLCQENLPAKGASRQKSQDTGKSTHDAPIQIEDDVDLSRNLVNDGSLVRASRNQNKSKSRSKMPPPLRPPLHQAGNNKSKTRVKASKAPVSAIVLENNSVGRALAKKDQPTATEKDTRTGPWTVEAHDLLEWRKPERSVR